MLPYKTTEVETVIQGGPIVDSKALIYHQSYNCVFMEIDLDTKHCEVNGYGGDSKALYNNCIFIHVSEYTSESCGKYNKDLEEISTEIAFPRFKDFDIFSYNLSRYTLRVTLIKDQTPLLKD